MLKSKVTLVDESGKENFQVDTNCVVVVGSCIDEDGDDCTFSKIRITAPKNAILNVILQLFATCEELLAELGDKEKHYINLWLEKRKEKGE